MNDVHYKKLQKKRKNFKKGIDKPKKKCYNELKKKERN